MMYEILAVVAVFQAYKKSSSEPVRVVVVLYFYIW
jgi:hypothetical protein